ncbi:MAG: hypothetical protein LAQ69_38790 [Acidobacteriia bacterium]|nr:hypothetical protein [Terriglobia bacterium]
MVATACGRSPAFPNVCAGALRQIRLNGKAAAGNAYDVADMASLLEAVRNAGANNLSSWAPGVLSDFSQWVALGNKIPTPASRLKGLSIANLAVSHSTT